MCPNFFFNDLQVLSSYGKYGTGRLLHNDLQRFYVSCIIDPTVVNNKHAQKQQQLTTRQLELVQRHSTRIDAVWRDIRGTFNECTVVWNGEVVYPTTVVVCVLLLETNKNGTPQHV